MQGIALLAVGIRIMLNEPKTKKPRALARGLVVIKSLAVSYSRMGTPTLPSALKRFTAEFGMDQVVPLRYGRQA